MKINNYVIINQITKSIIVPKNVKNKMRLVISLKDKGLSKSRNLAILRSTADICTIADDDMFYCDNYETIITSAYKKYPDADIIAFYAEDENGRQKNEFLKEGRLGLIKSMKIASWQITFNRKRIVDSGVHLDEQFGAGTKKFMGEENIFLFDCYRKGLKVYYIPIKIATMNKNAQSTWFKGYDKEYLTVKGMVFYRMSKILSIPFVMQFAIRKRKLYISEMSTWCAIRYMMSGLIQQVKNEK